MRQTVPFFTPVVPSSERLRALIHEIVVGLIYWLAFLLVLEPDNILKASGTTHALLWSQEIIRITAATLLGTSVTPALFALVRYFPVEGPSWRLRLVIEILVSAASAGVLIFISCVLADWLLASERRPFEIAVAQEFQANWTLLTFAIGGLLTVAHTFRFRARKPEINSDRLDPLTLGYIDSVIVRSRGHLAVINLADVTWIEAQGNYLAFHTSSGVHLHREGLSRFEQRLDPRKFVRIHRRMVVAIHQIIELRSVGGGDASLTLRNGTELRISRAFRSRVFSIVNQS